MNRVHEAQQHTPPQNDLEWAGLLDSWEFVISDIPTHHLEECFKRALKAKASRRETYPLSAPEVYAEWLDYRQEIAQRGVQTELGQLMAGRRDREKLFTVPEWKWHHSDENPEHDLAKCEMCKHRLQQGKCRISEIRDFSSYIGQASRAQMEQAARAASERMAQAIPAELADDDDDMPF